MVRQKRKATIKELEGLIEDLEGKVQNLQNLTNAIIGELNGVAGLIITHLVEEGKMERMDCPKCEQTNHLPRMDELPAGTDCQFCGWPLFDEEE